VAWKKIKQEDTLTDVSQIYILQLLSTQQYCECVVKQLFLVWMGRG